MFSPQFSEVQRSQALTSLLWIFRGGESLDFNRDSKAIAFLWRLLKGQVKFGSALRDLLGRNIILMNLSFFFLFFTIICKCS